MEVVFGKLYCCYGSLLYRKHVNVLCLPVIGQLQHQLLQSDYNDPFWELSRSTLLLKLNKIKVCTFVLL